MPITNLTLTADDHPLPCPFCGGADLELSNTHTACYTVVCPCGVEVTGASFSGNYSSDRIPRARHVTAKANALAAWNRRAPSAPAPATRVAAKPT